MGRLGFELDFARMNELSETTPVLVDLKPTGNGYMEDLYAAGGIPAAMRELRHLLHLDCLTVAGETLGERLDRPAGPRLIARSCGRSPRRCCRMAGWCRCSAR